MAKLNILTLGSSKTYTKESLLGGGAVVGKNVTISSITPITGGNRVTFSYTLDNGTVKTSTMDVMDGKDGVDGTNGTNGKDGQPGKDGTDGIGISKIEKIGTVDLVDTYRITFTDNSTFDYEVKNGKDGTGGGTADVPIEKIKVNGELQTPVNKVVDITVPEAYDDTALVQRISDIESDYAKTSEIPTKISELENDSNYLSSIPEEYVTETELEAKGYLTEHQDISGKVDKVDGKSLIADTEIERLASVDNYDDTQVKTQIQTVANGLMDSVGYSADYKTIDIIAKNGVKKSVNVAPIISHASITELSDVDTTNKATGKALVYNATTSKHEYADVSGTDEKVKMDVSTDAKYLGELLDNVTIANENGELKVKKLDGQEVTITEINYLKGLTMNVMDLVNMFSNGGVKIINTPVATYAELLTLDKSSFIEGISYLVYVLADENHDNAKTTYLVDKDSETPTYFGFADSHRDFTTNPIDLATEITGKLGISNMDSDAIKALFTVDDTYKTETATNNAFSTHGAKALYDELLLSIGGKANDSDLTAHKDDTDIHVSTEDRTKWDTAKTHADSAHAPSNAQENVLETVKVNGTALTPSSKAVNIDLSDYAKKADIPTTLPANGGNADTVNNHTVETDVPADAVFTDTIYDDTEVKGSIEEVNSNLDTLAYGENAGGKNLIFTDELVGKKLSITQDIGGIAPNGDTITFSISTTTNDDMDNSKSVLYIMRTDGTNSTPVNNGQTLTLTDDDKNKFLGYRVNVIPSLEGKIVKSIQVEVGTTVTPYKPYIPSVKMLATENEQQNTEAMDLKMLGWTVPSECPIQNYVDGNGVFHQRVGRVDMSDLSWYFNSEKVQWATSDLNNIIKSPISDDTIMPNVYSRNQPIVKTSNQVFLGEEGIGVSSNGYIYYKDSNTSANNKPTGYLYFELATEISMNVDGNEAVTKVNDSLSSIGKCKNLLNPTLQTTTLNGVTCTNNGDGTYTLNGTNAQSDVVLYIDIGEVEIPNKNLVILGSKNTNVGVYIKGTTATAYGNKITIHDSDKGVKKSFGLAIKQGATITNEIVKPMLCENLNATYDDFVPYTGDGNTLTHDVADLKNDLSVKKFELVAGVLWLCVCGKHCVLTLNGYNLTEPTHFDKLEEYQPYLVARNVVSNGNSVCIAAVEPNGNINASDLVVGTSLTGQLFGEISWIANI